MNDKQTSRHRRVRRRFSAEDRARLIHEFRASGFTARAFCKQEGIHPVTLNSWLRKAEQAKDGASFTELMVPMSEPAPVEMDLPNGVRIRVRNTGDVSGTVELVRAVAASFRGDAPC